MAKDLANSRLDRQNILNNELAIEEIKEVIGIETICYNQKYYLTKEAVANYFEVDVRTIERYISSNGDELKDNGFEVLKGKKLQDFIYAYDITFATDINATCKMHSLSVFDFKSFLNISMLLSESDKAKELRQLILDVVIDLINRKTGGGTKYNNKRDKDEYQKFLGATGDELERLMLENQNVLKRLKARE